MRYTSQLKEAVQDFDIEKFLIDEDVPMKKSGDERIMDCPDCSEDGHSDKLWFNVKKKKGWCYVCEQPWSTIKIIGHHLKLSPRNPVQFKKLCDYLLNATGVTHTSTLRKSLKASRDALAVEETEVEAPRYVLPPAVDLPAEFVTYPAPAPKYLAKRGVTEDHIREYHLGWCLKGYYKNRLIIPVIMKKRVVSYIARYMGTPPEGVKKYLYPKGNPTGKTLFNYDSARRFKTVILTEGYLDAIAVGPDAMGLGGKSLSDQQALLLAELNLDEVIVMLDGDEAGRTGARKVAQKLASFVAVRIAELPEGKDPDELTPAELAAIRRNAVGLSASIPEIKIDLDF